MDCRLRIIKLESYGQYLQDTFRFAVVDYSRSESYPSNFVCMLPMKIAKGKNLNVFEKVFGDDSLAKASTLLKDSLKREHDSNVKAEISRRLELLEPKETSLIKCCSCGKTFKPKGLRRFKRHFCGECLQQRYRQQ